VEAGIPAPWLNITLSFFSRPIPTTESDVILHPAISMVTVINAAATQTVLAQPCRCAFKGKGHIFFSIMYSPKDI
jgi:hypothetical protein